MIRVSGLRLRDEAVGPALNDRQSSDRRSGFELGKSMGSTVAV